MVGQFSLPNENPSLPLQVDTDNTAVSQDVNVASGRSTRLLWTGFGFAVIMLCGACARFPLASHASARASGLVPQVAFNSSMLAFLPGSIRARPTALRPVVLPGVKQQKTRQPLSVVRRSAVNDVIMAGLALKIANDLVGPSKGTMSKAEALKMAQEKKVPIFGQGISFLGLTEPAFTGRTTNGYKQDNKESGTYVGAISGTPLFDSGTKFDSGTGWPSFFEALPGGVIEKPGLFGNNFATGIEILDATSGAHLGHVFPDGPPPTGKRYCMNAGAMTFVPADSTGSASTSPTLQEA